MQLAILIIMCLYTLISVVFSVHIYTAIERLHRVNNIPKQSPLSKILPRKKFKVYTPSKDPIRDSKGMNDSHFDYEEPNKEPELIHEWE